MADGLKWRPSTLDVVAETAESLRGPVGEVAATLDQRLGASKSANTYRLALLILMEAYRDKRGNGRINLSTQVTGIPGSTRRRAARELVQLGLITLEERDGTEVFRARVIL